MSALSVFESRTAGPESPLSRFEAELRRIVERSDSNTAPGEVARMAIEMLESASLEDAAVWEWLLRDGRLSALERHLTEPEQMLAGYEQELFAPAGFGVRERALALIEALGRREPGASRNAERLLHAAGEARAAYRIERSRRPPAACEERRAVADALRLPMVVAVAGGHARLRAMIGRDLRRDGVCDLREIPSAYEASRTGRDVAAKLAGADLVVLIVRQIAHSTSNQAIAAANRLGIAVTYASSSSIASVRHEVEAFARRTRSAE